MLSTAPDRAVSMAPLSLAVHAALAGSHRLGHSLKSLVRDVTRLVRATLRLPHVAANRLLHRLESTRADGGTSPLEFPPVFIIGAPRTGSTLLCQTMVDYFDIGYFSNLHCAFFGAPSLAQRVLAPALRRRRSDFRSVHGQTRGWHAPSECGKFWYQFFRSDPQVVGVNDVKVAEMARLRGALRSLGDEFERPVLFKNIFNALRLEPLARAVPEATFIVLNRDIVDAAHSILETRHRLFQDYAAWWSCMPENTDRLTRLPAHEQVVEQIRGVYRLIENARRNLDDARFLDITYEEFCANTSETLERIREFQRFHGAPIEKHWDVPSSFRRRSEVRIPQDLYDDLVGYAHASSNAS